jgi:iron complex transport system permease protein
MHELGTGQFRDDSWVLLQLRLPRVLAAMVIGAALASAGAAYQGMFRNPLVSPDILGVAAGAGLGAVLAIFLSLSLIWVQLFAFIGGLAAVWMVYSLAKLAKRHEAVLVLVLAGVALSALLGAAIALFKLLADPYNQLPSITFWLMGGLNATSLNDLLWVLPFLLLALIPLWQLRWRINLLALSDDEAHTLGLNVPRTRLWLILSATLMTACATAISGIIGWVGLIIPHIARLIVGPEFSRLLPASLLLGAVFLLLCDTLARSLASIELPLGVVTAFIGAPFFIFLLLSGGRP